DWYIELVKTEMTIEETSPKRDEIRTRIMTILEQALRLLHPFMPFLTEELWQKLPGVSNALHNAAYKSAEQTIMLADFPNGDTNLIDEKSETEMQAVIELISKVRNIRAEMNIKPSERVPLHIFSTDENLQKIFGDNMGQIMKLARTDTITIHDASLSDPKYKNSVPKASARAVLTGGAELAIPLEGLIDFDKERERLENQLNKLETENERLQKQLSNQNFVDKAPPEKVQEIRNRAAEIETQTKALTQNLEALQ
ncbi:MAG: class I tRNA ligase family protein, partial [Pyrinomonadaceae bacterium]